MDALTAFKDNCGFGLLANIKNIPSHENLENAIEALERMMHRGAIAADGKSGDGCGLLLSMPQPFIRKIAKIHDVVLPDKYAIAMLFIQDEKHKEAFIDICERNDLKVLLFREVPIQTSALGTQALETLPAIIQAFVAPNSLMATKRFQAILYLTRKEIEHEINDQESFYISSFSDSVISYKGLVMPTHLKEFYPDLADSDFKISFALFHQRFSTNTLPKWRLAQPFRTIAHNGEINSITANRFNVSVKCESLTSPMFSDEELGRMMPILEKEVSDSASVDNVFEFLLINGVDFFKAARSLIPAPWQNAPAMDAKLRAFYEFTSTRFEAWDGPAAISLTDGRYIGCILDRNGLRPAKYIVTSDDMLLITSEYGVLDIDEEKIVERGRLQSGEMIGLDLKFGQILYNNDINDYLKDSNPYSKWLNQHMVYLQENIGGVFNDFSDYQPEDLHAKQRYFNITQEVLDMVIEPMMNEGKEPVGSMGDDTPLACFSNVQRSFCDYFKQKFAQVTNPPIDPYREKVVMSLNTGFGEMPNMIGDVPETACRLKAISPLITKEKYDILMKFGSPDKPFYQDQYKYAHLSTCFKTDLQGSLKALAKEAVKGVRDDNARLILLDDRETGPDCKTIPMAMAVGYLNYALKDASVRYKCSLIAVSGEVFDAHSACVLLGYGVTAMYPYMLYSSVHALCQKEKLDAYTTKERFKNTLSAMNNGILKIMSKMGICTVSSYRNSALFDVIGLSQEVVQDCFRGSKGLLQGLSYAQIESRINRDHACAFSTRHGPRLFPINMGGFYKHIADGEYHDYGPETIFAIHKVSLSGETKDFAALKSRQKPLDYFSVRECLDFASDRQRIDIKEVEPKEEIFKRFESAAMSIGSISPEAHEMIARVMNRLGGRSNSGEGGEAEWRLKSDARSKIKQIASGRFGVTPAYLRSAEEIQIKVAQGAKPGEGGQLPGHKVTPLIASLRYTVPGVSLISPPPHHDIYSIEDLAQLIFDLKQVNPDARICVKLVSTHGVGTIAAGVAKAYADKIIISGGDGGTGAAPLTSIKYAGNPWEFGLAEAHNALKANHLREFVTLQTDGGLKTGVDVVKAMLLGAETYGFGTSILAVLGCKMLRVCHQNRCTVGVATQDERLREYYVGTKERLTNYLTLLAEDIREIMAGLGYRTIEELVGRSDLLKIKEDAALTQFNFDQVLVNVPGSNTRKLESNDPFDKNEFEKEILKDIYDTIQQPENKIQIERTIRNTNRSFGALISGEIAKYYGNKGLEEDTVSIKLNGTAGQSLGAFLIPGISLYVNGAANDYVGKSMHGGKIVINPKYQAEGKSCAGNTCLYGATGGKLLVAGEVGERFAVRNSGCMAIVEGTGDHACEYMTGGAVVILGNTGVNFGAGMTGGIAFVYDKRRTFFDHVNHELINIVRIDMAEADEPRHYLKKLLKMHINETQSVKAKMILDNFRDEVRDFWMATPKNMKKLPLNLEEGD